MLRRVNSRRLRSLPFAAVDASTKTKIALGVFAVILAALYLRAAIFYIHPLLLMAGYHVYDATTGKYVATYWHDTRTLTVRDERLPMDDFQRGFRKLHELLSRAAA